MLSRFKNSKPVFFFQIQIFDIHPSTTSSSPSKWKGWHGSWGSKAQRVTGALTGVAGATAGLIFWMGSWRNDGTSSRGWKKLVPLDGVLMIWLNLFGWILAKSHGWKTQKVVLSGNPPIKVRLVKCMSSVLYSSLFTSLRIIVWLFGPEFSQEPVWSGERKIVVLVTTEQKCT